MKQTYDTSISNLIQVKKKRQQLTKTNGLTSHQVTDTSSANPSLTLQKAPPFSNLDPKDASSITSLTHQKAPIISNFQRNQHPSRTFSLPSIDKLLATKYPENNQINYHRTMCNPFPPVI